ncbi:MAG TPA: MFS transporter [Burkholderiales bacterium]|nr:MFS transporter [Burkholderiales bacterium]
MLSFQRYHDLFKVPQLRATLVASIIGRLPIGIAGLAILLFVQRKSGSFALAGSASALYVLGLAVVAPFLGRITDQLGPRPVLAACGLLYPAALVGLAAVVLGSGQRAGISAMAFVAGATLPPVSACIRAMYPRMISEPALLQTAYSVDSALVEAVFVLGPALVAACIGLGHPEAAVLIAAASAAVGCAIFIRSPAVKAWAPSKFRIKGGWLGVLGSSRLLIVFAATVLYSMAFGLFELAVTAHAASKGMPAAAGVALALASLGSGAGAVVYGSRHWQAPIRKQFVWALMAMAAGILLLVPIDNLVFYSIASIATGIPMATVIATQSMLIARFAPRERLAESFTWGSTCLLAGVSAGIAAGGALAETYAPYWLLIAAGGSTAAAAVIALSVSRDETQAITG